MTALFAPRLTCLSLTVAGLLLSVSDATASDCKSARAARWNPERSWPSSCEVGVPVDGYVLLEGDALDEASAGGDGRLEVVVQRVSAGVALETYAGTLSEVDETSALFRSERPLVANADYVIVARRVGSDGAPIGESFSSAFTTGTQNLEALRFRHGAQLQLETFEKPRKECVQDECGVAQCTPTGEQTTARLVRISVPPIDGGIGQKPLKVTAQLTLNAPSQAPVVATSDSVATQAGKRSFITVELPPLANAAEACITLHAQDVAGHEARLEAGCVALAADTVPAAAAPVPDEPAMPSAVAPSAPSAPSTSPAVAALGGPAQTTTSIESIDARDLHEGLDDAAAEGASEGCSAASSGRGLSHFAWLALALAIVRARARRRCA